MRVRNLMYGIFIVFLFVWSISYDVEPIKA